MIDKQCKETVYLTPERILSPVRTAMGGQIFMDPATEPDNPTRARHWYTKEDDGLSRPWPHDTFVNPPYGRELQQWAKKIGEEARVGTKIIALLPGQRFETTYWQEHILIPELAFICFIRRRIQFLRPDRSVAKSNPYGSMLYLFNYFSYGTDDCFASLGKVTRVAFERDS